ncbi:MAG TPA: hypothetical protein VF532_07550 [Candidatus Angelobacter sp.]
MPTKTLNKVHTKLGTTPAPPSLDISYTMGPITGPDKVIGLGQSYAFGFNITANTNRDSVYAVSAIALVNGRGQWTAQILDPPVVPIPAHKSATVLVQVTATTIGDTIQPSRCEVVLSAVEISPVTHVIPGQARLMLMALYPPPTPDPRVHVVLGDTGAQDNRFGSGLQVGLREIEFKVFVTEPGDYTVTAELRDPTGWTIGSILGSPFHIAAGDTAGKSVFVPLKHAVTARQTDLFLTVAGGPGISAKFALPIMP